MKALCEQCGKQYQVDVKAIKGTKARFKCKNCGNMVTVSKEAAISSQLERYDFQLDNLPTAETQELNNSYYNQPKSKSTQNSSSKPSYQQKTKAEGASLVTKFIGIMLIVSLVPFCAVWWILFSQIRIQIKQDTEALIDQVATDLTVNVNLWIDNNIRALKSIATLGEMSSMDPLQQTPLLQAIQKQYPWMYLVFSTDVNGINVARSDDKALSNYSDRQYFKEIMEGKTLAWQVLIGKSSGKPTLVLAVPIVREGLTVGVLANAMTIDDISKRIANWKRGDTGMAFMVDENGKVIAHQNEDFVLQQKNLSSHPLISQFINGRIGTIYFDYNGGQFIGNVQGTRYGWALAVQQNESEAFEALRQTLEYVLMGLIATAVVVIIIAWILGRVIVKPIKELTEAAERISVGDLDTEINIRSKDEIAILGTAISRMQESIRLSIKRLRR